MDLTHLGGVLTGVLTATTIVTGGLLGLQRGTMTTIRTTAEDLRGRVGDLTAALAAEKQERAEAEADLRAQMARQTAEAAVQATELAEQRSENELLRQINSQAVNWTAVTDMLAHHHDAAEAHWTNLDGSTHRIEGVLRSMADTLALQRRTPDESTST